MPDGSAYQYVTATLDLALFAEEHNLLVANDHGELLTTARLPTPPGDPSRARARARRDKPQTANGRPLKC